MSSAIPKKVGLGCLRNVAKQARGGKPGSNHSSTVSATVPAARFLSWAPALTSPDNRL